MQIIQMSCSSLVEFESHYMTFVNVFLFLCDSIFPFFNVSFFLLLFFCSFPRFYSIQNSKRNRSIWPFKRESCLSRLVGRVCFDYFGKPEETLLFFAWLNSKGPAGRPALPGQNANEADALAVISRQEENQPLWWDLDKEIGRFKGKNIL